jgi:(1->4)-alpha-D-glucan 1-alpha-D-glucosylmutase
VLKLASPGVPDFYQGTELWDLSLVDPDNRRPVDFAARARLLDEIEPLLAEDDRSRRAAGVAHLLEGWEDGRLKLFVTASGLRLRRDRAALFGDGGYVPLDAAGDRAEHVVAFARVHERESVIAVVPRLVATLAARDGAPAPAAAHWGDTHVILPASLAGGRWRDVLTGAVHAADAGNALRVRDLHRVAPVALLASV